MSHLRKRQGVQYYEVEWEADGQIATLRKYANNITFTCISLATESLLGCLVNETSLFSGDPVLIKVTLYYALIECKNSQICLSCIVTEETISLAACPSLLADAEPVQFTTLERVSVRIEM